MKLEFANTDKKINSTAIVSSYPLSLTGAKFKEECNLTFPVFMIGTNSISYTSYNYVKVTFDNNQIKYYFINSFELGTNNCWYINCTMDVLATFKSSILAKSLYVNRSYSNHNRHVPDTRYGATTHYTIDNKEFTLANGVVIKDLATEGTTTDYAYFTKTIQNGYFYLKVVDSNTSIGTALYCLSYNGFTNFIGQIFNTDFSEKFPQIADGVALGIANPIQYITECFWLPFKPTGSLDQVTIKLGPYPVPSPAGFRITNPKGMELSFNMSFSHHPSRSRGDYFDMSPYTSRQLVFYPFGVYDLTMPAITSDTTTVGVNIKVDLYTGESILRVTNYEGALLITDTKNYKVPIQLNESSLTLIGALGTLVAAGGTYTATKTINPSRVEHMRERGQDVSNLKQKQLQQGNAIHSIGEIIQASGTEIKTNGTLGALLPYSIKPVIYQTFYYAQDEDLDHNGRPLCQVKQLSTLSGYCECEDDDIGITGASQDQLNMIKNFLTGGFFIE